MRLRRNPTCRIAVGWQRNGPGSRNSGSKPQLFDCLLSRWILDKLWKRKGHYLHGASLRKEWETTLFLWVYGEHAISFIRGLPKTTIQRWTLETPGYFHAVTFFNAQQRFQCLFFPLTLRDRCSSKRKPRMHFRKLSAQLFRFGCRGKRLFSQRSRKMTGSRLLVYGEWFRGFYHDVIKFVLMRCHNNVVSVQITLFYHDFSFSTTRLVKCAKKRIVHHV